MNCQAPETSAVRPPNTPVPTRETWKFRRRPLRSMTRPARTGAAKVTKANTPTRYSMVGRDRCIAGASAGTARPSMTLSIDTSAQAAKASRMTKVM
jgi:hypothetical protein